MRPHVLPRIRSHAQIPRSVFPSVFPSVRILNARSCFELRVSMLWIRNILTSHLRFSVSIPSRAQSNRPRTQFVILESDKKNFFSTRILSLKNMQVTLYHAVNSQSPHRLLNWRSRPKITQQSDTPYSRPLRATAGIAHHNSDDATKTVFHHNAMKIMTENHLRKGFLGVRLAFLAALEMIEAFRLSLGGSRTNFHQETKQATPVTMTKVA